MTLPVIPKLKESNPKDVVGATKVTFSALPVQVLGELALAMAEGALKYGRSNYRVVGVRTSVYFDAALRHLFAFWEGQDVDPDSGLPHIVKAMACLSVLRDSQLQENCVDDRPPRSVNQEWVKQANERMVQLLGKIPEESRKRAFTQVTDGQVPTKEEPKVVAAAEQVAPQAEFEGLCDGSCPWCMEDSQPEVPNRDYIDFPKEEPRPEVACACGDPGCDWIKRGFSSVMDAVESSTASNNIPLDVQVGLPEKLFRPDEDHDPKNCRVCTNLDL